MPGASVRSRIILVATAAVTLGIDIVSKFWALDTLAGHGKRIGSITLRLVHNHGVVLGMGAYLPAAAIIVLTASIATAVAISAWRGAIRPPIAAGLVVGGAIANVVDRIIGGSVIDFISIGRWPIFNLADALLLVGVVLLIL